MFCRDCRYPLDGLPAGICPECGQAFDPARPHTFRRKPSLLTRRQQIRLGSLTGFIAAIVLILAFGPLPYARYLELDRSSGRERTVYRVFGIAVHVRHEPTALSEFVEAHLEPRGPSDWWTALRRTPFSSARINYMAGGQRFDLKMLTHWLEISDAPLEVRIRITEAVLDLMAQGDRAWFDATLDGNITIYDSGWTLIDSWSPELEVEGDGPAPGSPP